MAIKNYKVVYKGVSTIVSIDQVCYGCTVLQNKTISCINEAINSLLQNRTIESEQVNECIITTNLNEVDDYVDRYELPPGTIFLIYPRYVTPRLTLQQEIQRVKNKVDKDLADSIVKTERKLEDLKKLQQNNEDAEVETCQY
jgi:hypothetical protein